jgi:type III restriction enzyme
VGGAPADYRVAEVRLLHDVEEVGETRNERSRAKDNLLIVGDALNALTSLCELPELAREYVGKVKLAYLDRAAASLVRAVTAEHRRFVGRPEYDEVIETTVFAPVRVARAKRSQNRSGAFERSVGYEGWTRSMYVQVWFDSSTERTLATILDDADDIRYWVRLKTGDLPILWQGDGREYNPDFIAVDAAGTHWLVESKMDKELESSDVKGKESAALRWANHVTAKTGVAWRYLLVGETDIATARGSWSALRGSGRA